MKKLVSGIFHIFIYANLLIALASATYISLPEEYQILQGMDLHFLLIGGGTTTLLGSAGLYFKYIMGKHDGQIQDKQSQIVDRFVTITREYGAMRREVSELREVIGKLTSKQELTNDLIKTDLKVKLDNPLVDELAKKLIEKVLHE